MKSKKHGPIIQYKPRNDQLVKCLLSEVQWLGMLQDKPYNKLVSYLISISTLEEQELWKKMTIKSITDAVGDKRVSQWLPIIYEDLIELNFSNPERFRKSNNDVLYHLYFRDGYDGHFQFAIWINKPLQVYDEFQWQFLKGKFSMDFFWVEKISHEFNRGKLISTVWLKQGLSNKYKDLLLDRAEFEGKLKYSSFYSMRDYEIDEELSRIYK